MIKKQLIISFGLIGLLDGATAQAGCSGAACSINTNWDEHSPSRSGWSDVILGLFWNQSAPGSDWSWFSQGTLQSSASSDATFNPGNQINLDGGTRYALSRSLCALLQLNAQWNGTDSGESAAHTHTGAASSGGKIISLSPGVSYALTRATQLYGMFQVPVYRYVNGEQLTADSSLTTGISHRF